LKEPERIQIYLNNTKRGWEDAVQFVKQRSKNVKFKIYSKKWLKALSNHSLTLLFVFQVLFIFLICPFSSTGILNHDIRDWFTLLLAIVSVFTIVEEGANKTFTSILVLLLASFVLKLIHSQEEPLSFKSIHMAISFVFFATITFSVSKAAFRAGKITYHKLLGAVVVYLNFSLIFIYIYGFIATFIPNAFTNVSTDSNVQFSEMIYFSLTTLTTTGYGDIVPNHPIARSMANLESVIGELYLVAIFARLVSLHISQKDKT
jgi:hypothetical protein